MANSASTISVWHRFNEAEAKQASEPDEDARDEMGHARFNEAEAKQASEHDDQTFQHARYARFNEAEAKQASERRSRKRKSR